MKTKSLCSAVLLATLVGGMALPAGVSAAPASDSLKSKGTMKFEEDNSQKPIIDPEDPNGHLVDPTDPGKDPVDPVIVNPDRGSFSIDAVTNLDFGVDKIKAFGTDPFYYAKAIPTASFPDDGDNTDKSKVTPVTRGNFVQFTDVRGTVNHAYKVNAQMTKQFESTANAGTYLEGATIDFANATLNSKEPAEKWPAAPSAAFLLAGGKNVGEEGPSVTVLDNTEKNKGIGTYSIEFGKYGDGTEANDTTAKSVKLTVPNSNVLVADTYRAEVTWTIIEAN